MLIVTPVSVLLSIQILVFECFFGISNNFEMLFDKYILNTLEIRFNRIFIPEY